MKKIKQNILSLMIVASLITLTFPINSFAETTTAIELNQRDVATTEEKVETVATSQVVAEEITTTEDSQTTEKPSLKKDVDPQEKENNHGKQVVKQEVLGSKTIIIPDVALKAAINSSLNQAADADISLEQIESIVNLALNGSHYSSLTGLEQAKNLANIDLINTQIQDFSTLTKLEKLQNLYIEGGLLTDSNMPNLQNTANLDKIYLSSVDVTDKVFEKFNQNPKLRSLFVQYNKKVTDISSLASLPNLETLYVQFDGIEDFTSISKFPKLRNLGAYGQSTGNSQSPLSLRKKELSYNKEQNTLFIPFTLMEGRLTNFNGYQPPFTDSTTGNNMVLELDDEQISGDRLLISNEGILVSGVNLEKYDGLSHFMYNARYNNPEGSYETPLGFDFYSISAGTYYNQFEIDYSFDIIGKDQITYWQDHGVDEGTFLKEIDAYADGHKVVSDFLEQVDFTIPGEYLVTLNATNTAGLSGNPKIVIVTVLPKPIITATATITYNKDIKVTSEQFLIDILGKVSDGSPLQSDFLKQVDFSKVGSYQVLLTAKNEAGIEADPVTVTVVVEEAVILPTEPEEKPSQPNPEPEPEKLIQNQKENSQKKSDAHQNISNQELKKLPKTGQKKGDLILFISGLAIVMFVVLSFFKKKCATKKQKITS